MLKCWWQAWMNSLFVSSSKSNSTTSDTIQAGERVLLQSSGKYPFLSRVLRPGGNTVLHIGKVLHKDIIGKRTRDTVLSSVGTELRILRPTLADYVTLTPRQVTPIYPGDANVIVSLLDLHISPMMSTKGPPSLEILEAGTGHGALTLYLARAIHTANAPQLEGKANLGSPEGHGSTWNDPDTTVDEGSHGSNTVNEAAVGHAREERQGNLYKHFEDQRRAVIHTVDISSKHSASGKRIVEGFRQGMYAGDVEFHVGDVSNWIDEQILSRSSNLKVEPFLSQIILGMPSIEHHVQKATSVLHVNGSLLAFNPSISQIVAIVDMVKRQCLPLHLERVLELGPNMTGGREWDVRFVKSRNESRSGTAEVANDRDKGTSDDDPERSESMSGTAEVAQLVNDRDKGTSDDDPERGAVVEAAEIDKPDHEETQAFGKQDTGWRMVCRPKVGQRVLAGGFLGVWKKMK